MKKLFFPLLLGLCIFVGCEKKQKKTPSSHETSNTSLSPQSKVDVEAAPNTDETQDLSASAGAHEELHVDEA